MRRSALFKALVTAFSAVVSSGRRGAMSTAGVFGGPGIRRWSVRRVCHVATSSTDLSCSARTWGTPGFTANTAWRSKSTSWHNVDGTSSWYNDTLWQCRSHSALLSTSRGRAHLNAHQLGIVMQGEMPRDSRSLRAAAEGSRNRAKRVGAVGFRGRPAKPMSRRRDGSGPASREFLISKRRAHREQTAGDRSRPTGRGDRGRG